MLNNYKKEELVARYDALMGVDGAKKEASRLEWESLRMNGPEVWNVHIEGNKEIEMEVGFEEFSLQVKQHTGIDVNELSTFQYFALKNNLKKQKSGGNN